MGTPTKGQQTHNQCQLIIDNDFKTIHTIPIKIDTTAITIGKKKFKILYKKDSKAL